MQVVFLRINETVREDALWLPGKPITPPTRGQRVGPEQTRQFEKLGPVALELAKWPSWTEAARLMFDASNGRLNPEIDLFFTVPTAAFGTSGPVASVLGRSASTDGQVLRRTAGAMSFGSIDLVNSSAAVEPKYESHLLSSNLTGFRLIDEEGVLGLSCLAEGVVMVRLTRYEVAMHVFVPFEEPVEAQLDDADRKFEQAVGWADE